MVVPKLDCRMIMRAAVLHDKYRDLFVGFDARHTRSDNYVMRLYFYTLEKGKEKIVLSPRDVGSCNDSESCFPTYMYGCSKDSEDAETHFRRLLEYEGLLECAGFYLKDAKIKKWLTFLGKKNKPIYIPYSEYRENVRKAASSLPAEMDYILQARNTVYQELNDFVVSRKEKLEKKEKAIIDSLDSLYRVFELMDKETFKYVSLQCSGISTGDERVKSLSSIRAEILKIKRYNQEIADYSHQISCEKNALQTFLNKMRWHPRTPFARRQFRTQLNDALATLYVSIGELRRG